MKVTLLEMPLKIPSIADGSSPFFAKRICRDSGNAKFFFPF